MGLLKTIGGATALVLALACAAGPASALQADCLWTHLAPAKRDGLLEAYRQTGPDSLSHLDFSDDDLAEAVQSCGLNEANSERGGHLIASTVVLLGSKRYFQDQRRIAGPKLEAGWSGLSAESRGKITRFAQQATLGQPTDGDDMAPVLEFAARLGIDLQNEADRGRW